MSWFGKIIGATIGFFLGGPIGMITGLVFGHMYDKGQELEQSDREGPEHRQYFFRNTGYNRSQMVFFVGAFSMLAKLSSADGRVTEGARRKVY